MRDTESAVPTLDRVDDVVPERAPLRWRAIFALLSLLPQATLSRCMGRLADIKIPPPLRTPVLGLFSALVGIDRGEAELPLKEYPSLNAYFVRRLRPGVREWPVSTREAGSPVDGRCGQLGRIEDGRIVQAKGRWYSCAELLDDSSAADAFEGGAFLTIYLSPRDYHRIHAPLSGTIFRARHIPGALLPVNPPGVLEFPDLFPRNERLVCYLDTEAGQVAVVAVGAINVGRISTTFDPSWSGAPWRPDVPGKAPGGWVTNRPGVAGSTHEYEPPIPVERGAEIMAFHLGSTVVLLFEPGKFELNPSLRPGDLVRLGKTIGTVRAG